MAFAPPRKPSGGSRLPVSRTSTSSVRSVGSSTTAPRSSASSARGGSCATGVPCGSSVSSRSGTRGGASSRGAAGPSTIETTSSTIIQPDRTITTRTERRTGPAPVRSSGYGMQRPATAPPTGAVPRYQPPRDVRSSGYGMPARTPGVCPGSASAARRPVTTRGPMETITSTTTMTREPDGGETIIEEEERVIQPAPSARPANVCPGSQTAPRSMLKRPAAGPAASVRTTIPRVPAGPAPGGRSSIGRPAGAASGMQKVTTRTSKTTFADGRNVQETSTRTERAPAPRSSGYGPPRRAAPASAASTTSVSSTVSTGAIPKVKTVTTRSSKTSVQGAKKTTVVQEVTKTVPDLPAGRYALSLKHAPHTKEGKLAKFSSPPELRHVMDREMPKQVKGAIMPPEYKGIQDVRKLKAFGPYKDTVSCAMDVTRGRPSVPPGYYTDPHEYSFLDTSIEPEEGVYSPRRGEATALEQEVGEALIRTAAQSPGKMVKVSGSRKSPGKAHVIMTDEGPVTATEQVITEKKVEKVAGAEKISRHITGIEKKGCGAIQTELDTQEIEPGAGFPAKDTDVIETVSVVSSVAVAPGGIKETTTTVIYETTKPPSPKIHISPQEVERLVEEEAIDVNKTLKLKPLDLKVLSPASYSVKKREHELKLNYSSIVELEHSIIQPEPTADQEQEEVQPEMVATMMYTDETRLALDAHPAQMYDVLFPDQRETTMMTVSSVAPALVKDVLVPHLLPEDFHQQAATREIEDVIAHVETKDEIKPNGNAFTEAMGQSVPIKNVSRRKAPKLTDVPLLINETPPAGVVDDMGSLMEIIGIPFSTSLTVEKLPEEERGEGEGEEDDDDEDDDECNGECPPIEHMLQLEPPTHCSRIQLRGSTRPPWFQGYYVALPEIPNLVRVEKTAESGLISAWRSVQPNFFPEDSIISV